MAEFSLQDNSLLSSSWLSFYFVHETKITMNFNNVLDRWTVAC